MGCLRESCSLPVDKLWRLCVMTQCSPSASHKAAINIRKSSLLQNSKTEHDQQLVYTSVGPFNCQEAMLMGNCWGVGSITWAGERYRRARTERRSIAAPSGTVCPRQIDLNQFTAWGHINPITTKLVFMVFIEAGAFAGRQHLGHFCAQPQSLPRRFRHFRDDNISASESTLHKEDEETLRLFLEVMGAYARMRSFFICWRAIIASPTMSIDERALTRQKVKGRACKSENPVHAARVIGMAVFLHAGLSQFRYCGWFQSLFFFFFSPLSQKVPRRL